ncbi:MFS transporter [Dictyobacter kobayashii]|uniref:MFS transporter n=2 Tax=Dictyobacter kobayashii TaxID=2014872 RepID=A0A402APU7_9CHLR|nr:MFS transporter [Dictyobacter kobayashii]
MVVIIGVFMSILDQTIVNIAIPRLQQAFGSDIHSVQWVLTAYILTLGIVTPSAAYFSDKWGIKRFYIISLAAFTAGSALCGLAWSLPVLIIFRILQGIGGAALFPLSITLLFREFPPQERGMAMGFFGIPALLAPALGPTLGGYLVTYANWQSIFYVNVPVGIAAVILASILLHEANADSSVRFDFSGFLLAALGLGAILYGLSDASTDGWGSIKVEGFILGGLLILLLFVVIELSIANSGGSPLLDLRIFSNGPFRNSSIANIFVTFSLFGGIFLFPIYLQDLRGQSAFQAGLTLLPQALASMLTVLIGGRLVDRIGVRGVMIPGLVILTIATWLLSFLTLSTPIWWLQFLLIARGLALGASVQPLTVAGLSQIGPRQLAQASALNTVTRSVSSSLGIAILATLVQTQNTLHYAHLAEQVTADSELGRLLLRLQAQFVARGASIMVARSAAAGYISRIIQEQSYVLALQDSFFFTLIIIIFAIIAVCFVSDKHKPASISPGANQEIEPGKRHIPIFSE